jgi:hypothetical protein
VGAGVVGDVEAAFEVEDAHIEALALDLEGAAAGDGRDRAERDLQG